MKKDWVFIERETSERKRRNLCSQEKKLLEYMALNERGGELFKKDFLKTFKLRMEILQKNLD